MKAIKLFCKANRISVLNRPRWCPYSTPEHHQWRTENRSALTISLISEALLVVTIVPIKTSWPALTWPEVLSFRLLRNIWSLSNIASKLRSGIITAMLRLSFCMTLSAGEQRKEIWERSMAFITAASVRSAISTGITRLLIRNCIRIRTVWICLSKFKNHRLRWLGHVLRMSSDRIPMQCCLEMDPNWEQARAIAFRAHCRATRSEARLVSKSNRNAAPEWYWMLLGQFRIIRYLRNYWLPSNWWYHSYKKTISVFFTKCVIAVVMQNIFPPTLTTCTCSLTEQQTRRKGPRL